MVRVVEVSQEDLAIFEFVCLKNRLKSSPSPRRKCPVICYLKFEGEVQLGKVYVNLQNLKVTFRVSFMYGHCQRTHNFDFQEEKLS